MIKVLIINQILGLILNNIINSKYAKYISMLVSIISLYIILYMNIKYNTTINDFQFRDCFDLYFYRISLGLDGLALSIFLILALIFPILFLLIIPNSSSFIIKDNERIVKINNILITMYILLILVFTSLDILIFFIFFEVLLIPMFLLIGIYGSRVNKFEASYRFFLYTLIGSLILLLAIIILFYKYGTTNLELLQIYLSSPNSATKVFGIDFLSWLWFAIFFSFLVKVPMFPLHSWLPEAHTEAPTIGSIILAAILLKLATFGIYRFSLNMFININTTSTPWSSFLPFIFILSIISILLASLTALRSIDLKKIIAYSSIAHMNFSIFALFSNDLVGLVGASYLIFSHAFISSALFLLIGILYIRYHSRNLYYYKGLFYTMPLFSFFFLFFSLANMSLPFTSSFISEFLILLSTLQFNFFISLFLLFSVFLSCCYIIWLANRILFSHLSSVSVISSYLDLSLSEFLALFPMFLFTLGFGLFPKPLFNLFTLNLINVIL